MRVYFFPLLICTFLALGSCTSSEPQLEEERRVNARVDDLLDSVKRIGKIARDQLSARQRKVLNQKPTVWEKEARIEVGQKLIIDVLGEEMPKTSVHSTSPVVVVRTDGYISYFGIGDIKAAGLSYSELKEEVTEKLKKIIRKPVVTVMPLEPKSFKVSIFGAVSKPGRHEIKIGDKLVDILAASQGFRKEGLGLRTSIQDIDIVGGIVRAIPLEDADLSGAFVSRRGEILDIDFEKLLRDKNMNHNIYLHPGDFIYIPRSKEKKVFVVGEVRRALTIRFTGRITLVEAIAHTGGYNRSNSDGNVYLVRGRLSAPTLVKEFDLDEVFRGEKKNFPLENNDIIYVAPGIFTNWARIANRIAPLLRTAINAEDVYLKGEAIGR